MNKLDFENEDARPQRNARSSRRKLFGLVLLGSTAVANPAFADTVAKSPPPAAESIDINGVDLISGQFSPLTPSVQIGDDVNGLRDDRSILGTSFSDTLTSYIQDITSSAVITLDGTSISFSGSGGAYTPREQNGDVLTKDAGGYTLTRSDGTVYRYSGASYSTARFGTIFGTPLISITYPSGKKLAFTYTAAVVPNGGPGAGEMGLRLQSVRSNTGYQIQFVYAHPDLQVQSQEASWSDPILVEATNTLTDPCDPTANGCPSLGNYPNFAGSTATQTQKSYSDANNNMTKFALDAQGHVTSVTDPLSTVSSSIAYNAAVGSVIVVSSVTNERGTTNYSYSVSGDILTVTATNGSTTRQYRVDTANKHLLGVTDELGRQTTYEYNALQQLSKITYPKANFATFDYDPRGNLTTTTRHPKAGSALPNIVTSAAYPSSCANTITCNRPISTTDGNGRVTDYTYDPVHGGLLTVTAPAPTAGAVRPQVRYSYTQLDANGAPSASGVWMLTRASSCATQSSCAGTSDETVTSYSYGQNLLVSAITMAAGDGSVSSTRTMAYDKVGNTVAFDGPLPGSADTTSYKYDKNRQLTATISPDPDGSGPLMPRVGRITYSPMNMPAKIAVGTASDPSDAGVAAMTVLQATDMSYDGYGRKTSEMTSAGGATYSVTQYNYDSNSRLNCTAVRMNPAAFGSLPGDACTAGTSGSFGSDRITQNSYDAAGQLKSVTSALGTAAQRTESFTFNLNGDLQTVTDGKGNRTNYVYDDLVRLYQTKYPEPSSPGNSSATDYEQYGYDGNNNVTSRRIRNGTTISYTFDGLNRLTQKTLPSGAYNPTSTYSYDLLGRMITATSQTSAHTISNLFSYDALGRRLTDTSMLDGVSAGTKSMQYDAAGRRTRFAWSDGLSETYDYDNANEMTAIHENGGVILAGFTYDDLGRRTARSFANGTNVSYGYDPASRLTGLALNAGSNPTSISLGGYSPSGQIGSRTNSNDVYASTAGANANRSYATNGLNEYTTVGGVTQAYDAKGNLTSVGSGGLTYNAENQLSTGGGANLFYDAMGRLTYNSANGRYDYDGDQLVSELTAGGALTRRYAFGPAVDEPIVWYEGSGLASRRYLDGDERGSIVRITDAGGSALAINNYDEFGLPGSGNLGRFQYTGQAWFPELGLSNFKARMYSASLGRFAQPDPIGQESGPNLYNYAMSDPINRTDPTGLEDSVTVTGIRYYEDYSVGISSGSYTGPRSNFEAADRERASDDPGEVVVIGKRSCGFFCRVGRFLGLSLARTGSWIGGGFTGGGGGSFGGAGATGSYSPCCFTAGTKVQTPFGAKPIETLRVGDLVTSRDETSGQTASKRVISITPAHQRRIWNVSISYKDGTGHQRSERYETTADHPWRTRDGRWMQTSALKRGGLLAREAGTATVSAVVDSGLTKLTYNLEVADFHTYFVGEAQAWVHNACLSPNQMNAAWKRGQAPGRIGRTDVGKVTGEQQHTVIEGVGAINIDGTWKHGGGDLTRAEAGYLRDNGYDIPK